MNENINENTDETRPAQGKKKIWMTLAAVFTIGLAILAVWASTDPDALKAPIDLTINITHSDETELTVEIRTIRDNLAEALEEQGLIEGIYVPDDDDTEDADSAAAAATPADAASPAETATQSDAQPAANSPEAAADGQEDEDDGVHYRVTTVDGEYADYDSEQYWLCYSGGDRIKIPLDEIEIGDEDEYTLKYYAKETEDTAQSTGK